MRNDHLETIGALSNDLYRTAELFARGSKSAALRFAKEAQKRLDEIVIADLPSYLRLRYSHIVATLTLFVEQQSESTAEHLLMYSVLLSNYCSVELRKQL